jgi:hypothetical protein
MIAGVQRVAVVGSSGAAKSWLARRLAVPLKIPHVELDAIHHGPGWTALPAAEMRRQLDICCTADGGWVADGNYARKGGDVVRARADTVVWLDFPAGLLCVSLSHGLCAACCCASACGTAIASRCARCSLVTPSARPADGKPPRRAEPRSARRPQIASTASGTSAGLHNWATRALLPDDHRENPRIRFVRQLPAQDGCQSVRSR